VLPSSAGRVRVLPGHGATIDGAAHPTGSLRDVLRAATRDAHEGLHRHPGFAAIEARQIGLSHYRALLARLLGFYLPFEAAVRERPERSLWLAADLGALGMPPEDRTTLPLCPHVPRLDTPAQRIGALYVAEGSALGGRHLARRIDALVGPGTVAGRTYFVGRGADTHAAWLAFIQRLEAFAGNAAARRDITTAAIATFAAFGEWLDGWQATIGAA